MKEKIAEMINFIISFVGMLVMLVFLATFWKSPLIIFFGIGLGMFGGGIFRAIDQKKNK